MKVKVRKKTIYAVVWAAVLTALLSLILGLVGAPVAANAVDSVAESGSVIDYSADLYTSVILNVNGKTYTGTPESDNDMIATNNMRVTNRQVGYKTRWIALEAFCNDLLQQHYVLVNTDTPRIHNYSKEYFTVTADGATSSGYTNIAITAIKATTELAVTPRIALILEYAGSDTDTPHPDVAVTIAVDVRASSPVATPDTGTTTLYVGNQLDESYKTPITDTNNINYVALPISLENYTTKEIDLKRYLPKRKLYNPSVEADLEKTLNATLTPDTRVNLTSEQEKIAGAVLEDNEEKFLVFDDISRFYISNTPTGGAIGQSNVRFYDTSETARNLKFVVDVNIAEKDLTNPRYTKNGKIWKNDDAYFELSVELTNIDDANVKVIVKLPVVFTPAEKPKRNGEFTMPTALNAGSVETFDATPANAENVSANVVGYRSVRVYPAFLCDFPSYDGNYIFFVENEFPENAANNSYVNVEVVPQSDDNDQTYFIVTGKDNGSTDLVFKVSFKRGTTYDVIDVPVTFSVYGAYTVLFNIEGTKTRTFTINDSIFRSARDAGYQIIDAEIDTSKADGGNYAAVSCNNGIISVTPKMSILNTHTVGIVVTLADMEGHRIQLHCGMQIDMDKGDILTEWRTWQKVLLFGGIGLGVLLILLLVIWLFIRSAHRRKLDELETSAPTSAYIIKLNSTIAAAQAQQRLAGQPYGAPGQMMQLGAGTASMPAGMYSNQGALPNQTALPNGTAALGVTPQMSAPAYSAGTTSSSTDSVLSTPAPNPPVEEIYIPISDEDLLLRIYEEKFEPRGMLKRTFDKSKDLQQRELEKEKERIRENVRNGMSIEEACKSLKERQVAMGATDTTAAEDRGATEQVDPLLVLLGFDPSEPVVADVKKEEPKEDWSEEQKKLKEVEYNNLRLRAELGIIESRLNTIIAATEKTENDVRDSSAAIEQLTEDIKNAEQKLDDKNTDLVVTRGKAAKEALNKEIADLEAQIKTNKERIVSRKTDLENANGLSVRIKEISEDYAGKKEATEALIVASDQELESARADAEKAAELAERARKLALLNAQLEVLNPMMLTVNKLSDEIAEINVSIENSAAEKDSLKTRISALQTEMLSTTESTRIGELSETVKSLNKEMAEVDRKTTANTTLKTNKNIELSSVRRKANEYIDKESIELEDVITAEDKIIGQLALEKLTAQAEVARVKAEEEVTHWQNECDRLVGALDSDMAETVAMSAERVKTAEEQLAAARAKLDSINAAMETCEDDDQKLTLSMEQMTQQEEVDILTTALEEVRADTIRANLEFRTTGEGEVENARAEFERAKAEFARATEHFNEVSTGVNPLDLITSGSGVISQDRKKIEAENYKKKLEEQQKATEQARLQAQLAQEEAERAVIEAQRASEESKAEAERIAQEALEKARLAQEEAEVRAREDAERAREEAEEAKRLAQEEIERAREEAEEARRQAEEDAARAREEAEERAEEARRQAEEDAEKARLQAEEDAARVRKEAEEEAEKARLRAEEEKRKSEEEAEKARLQAEEEAKKLSEEEAKRKAVLDEKVARRKVTIAKLRDELKDITEEEQGNALREKFYQMQLGLDEDEKTSQELNELLKKSMDDAAHAAELARYKKLANQKPRRIVKKVTERVNRVPKSAHSGAKPRPASAGVRPGARPARPGARPSGAARPSGVRPGARPARPGTRPSGAARRPSGSRPTTRK